MNKDILISDETEKYNISIEKRTNPMHDYHINYVITICNNLTEIVAELYFQEKELEKVVEIYEIIKETIRYNYIMFRFNFLTFSLSCDGRIWKDINCQDLVTYKKKV